MSEKMISFEEVAKHANKDDIWIVVHGKAYNITTFLDSHPGGEEILLECAGTDATQAFEDIGHSTDAVRQLDEFYVADVEGAPKPVAKPQPVNANNTNLVHDNGYSSYLLPLAIILAAAFYQVYNSRH